MASVTLRLLILFLLFFIASMFFFSPGAHGASASRTVKKTCEKFQSGGRRIKVEVFAPAGVGKHPAVLVLHSSAGLLYGRGQLVDFCKTLAANGKVAMLVHYFNRTGTWMANLQEIEDLSATWVETVHDAVDFASTHKRVNPDSIGLFGYSLGAFIAVAEAVEDRRIDAVVEVAGGMFGGFENRVRRMPALLILHGRKDETVLVQRAIELERKAKKYGRPLNMKIYENEGHVLTKEGRADASKRALDFLARHLSEPTKKSHRR